MKLTDKLLTELQRRLKIGNRRGVHLNAIPGNSRYKFDINRLSHIDKNLPENFLTALLTELPLKFRISWKNNVPDLNTLFEEDQTQLVKITKALENLINQTEAIESEKGINTFGFGFPILARRDRSDNKLTVAPILIWSLRVRRTKEFNTWEILRTEDDPIYINEVLINHLQSDSEVTIQQIPNEMLDDGLITKEELIQICSKLIREVNPTSPPDLEDIFASKLGKLSSIGDKAHYEKLPLNSTNSFIDFGGLFSIFEVQKQNIINDYNNLLELEGCEIDLKDLTEHIFQPLSSIETDPSQQGILHSLENTRNILIQGPPGTGKSQTLTAVLINALENNKKTIVVCEKRTALEVLHDALIERGLGYHCVMIRDLVKDRKTVVDSVRDRVDSSDYKRYRYNFSKDALDNIHTKAKRLIGDINKRHRKVGREILGNKNWTGVVGHLWKTAKNQTDSTITVDKTQFKYTPQELDNLLDLFQKCQPLYNEYSTIASLAFINPKKLTGENPYAIEQSLDDAFKLYTNQLQQINLILELNRVEYFKLRKSEFTDQVNRFESLMEELKIKESSLEDLISAECGNYMASRQKEFEEQTNNICKITTVITTIFTTNAENPDLIDKAKTHSFSYKIASIFSKKKRQTRKDQSTLGTSFDIFQELLNKSKDLPNIRFEGTLENRKRLFRQFTSALANLEDNKQSMFRSEFDEFKLKTLLDSEGGHPQFSLLSLKISDHNNSVDLSVCLKSILNSCKDYIHGVNSIFRNMAIHLSDSTDIRLTCSFDKLFKENEALLSEIKGQIEIRAKDFDTKIQTEFQQLALLRIKPSEVNIQSLPILQEKVISLARIINSDNWSQDEIACADLYKFISDIEGLLRKKDLYTNNEKDLFTIEFKWFQLYNGLTDNHRAIVEQLRPKTDWRKSFLVFYLQSLLVSSADLDLPTNDNDLHELNKTLSEIETEQLRFIKQFWYSKQIDSTREFEQANINLTVENLYNKRSSNKYKRLSLRQIVQYKADLFTDFFPIILTSPDVASNLFKGMNKYFDIVMFDEASQLRLEDNLPALLKGKQIIIAGDEHQMPPSNYFSKVFDGSIEDEEELEEENEPVVERDDILLSCESLLDFGTELSFEKRYLDFHYRSRHPYLIDFSNYAFYNQRLKPLPNTFDYVPIKYVQVNGTFSDHTNDAEAEMVLSIVEKNINRLPNGKYPTVGIATFNIAQRNLIKSKILDRLKFAKNTEFNDKIQELEENGLFIKNLENIQGDERDIIILSTTYGVGKDRKFAQRFGPITHSKGYKLLNVIITRAKYKVYVCSSVPEQVFMNYKEHLVTEGSNNKKAVFYTYLAYCKATSDQNQELRMSVLTSLAENTTRSSSFESYKAGELESPFEEEVYQTLADNLGIEKISSQVQFAGFRIDLVYDSKIDGIPRIAIECDGAKYHSSKEAYLYDRHRQKILESHGFVFHRIWSTNWWRNVNRETQKLLNFIKETEATKNYNSQEFSKTAFAFTDDVMPIESYMSQSIIFEEENTIDTIRSTEATITKNAELKKDHVKMDSIVLLKYMNNGKNITVQLTANDGVVRDSGNGIQKIHYKSPLAESLLGHTVGDIVKVGNLDNYVEILDIVI
jgi:superfamily I DNA and/or RNA helicase/very-short-patch-repair endonuclease